MPIGTGIIYNVGDLILGTVSGSGTAFLETKIAAATSSIVYFDSNARINSASLNSITVGTASYVSGSTSIITNLTASNISASSITGSLFGTSSWAVNAVTASFVSNTFVQGGNSFGTTALLGTNDANSLAFETNGSTRMTINSGGQVGIGVSPVSHFKTYISDTHRGSLGSSSLYIETAQNQNQGLATSNNDSGITNAYTVNNFTSSTVLQNQASFNQMIIAGSGSFSGSYRAERNGILFSNSASLDSSGIIINTYLTNQISANIPTFSIPNWVAGTQTYVDLVTGNSTGSITNLYNHQINSPFPSGGSGGITVNNSYGIYIAKQKTTNIVTNGWGIYQIDTGDLNIFAGKTRIGSTTVPVNTLDVTGNISASVITASLFFGTASFALTASSLVSANSYTITNLTASNISASGTSSFGMVGIGTTSPVSLLTVGSTTVTTSSMTLQGEYQSSVFNNTNIFNFRHGGFDRWRLLTTQNSAASNDFDFSINAINATTNGYNTYVTVKGLTGNVGIGTTAPSYKLDVSGSVRAAEGEIIATGNNAAFRIYRTSGINYLDWASGQNLYLGTVTSEGGAGRSNKMVITNTGQVGIGTTSIPYTFDIYNTTAADALMSLRSSGSANARIYIDAANGDLLGSDYCYLGQDSGSLNFVINTGGNAGNIHLQPKGGTNNGILFVSGSTRFGIASSQTHQFTGSVSISGSLNATASWANNALTASSLVAANSYTITNLTASNISASGTSSFGYVGIGTTSPGALLEISSSTAASLLNVKGAGGNGILFVSGSGFVGIGTTIPATKLSISGEDNKDSGPILVLHGNATNQTESGRIRFCESNPLSSPYYQGAFIHYDGGANVFNIGVHGNVDSVTSSDVNAISIVRSTANVGIGTSSPAQKLDVSGSIYINNNASYLYGKTTSGSATRMLGINSVNDFYIGSVDQPVSSIRFNNGGADRVIIDSSGNVGIGVASPSGRLHITGSSTNGESLIYLSKGSASISQYYINAVDQSGNINYRLGTDQNGYSSQTLYRNGTSYVNHDAYWSSWINNANYAQGGLALGTGSLTHGYALNVSRPAVSGSLYVSGSSVFTGSVSISGSVTFSGPIIYDNAVLLDYGSTSTPVVSTNYAVLQNLTGSYNSAFFDYFASSGSNFRAGTVIAGWSGSSVNYTEYSTTDVGNTNQLSMSVDLSGSFVRLLTRVSTTINWNIKSAGRYL
jgi:hypothetical protein